MISNRLAYEMTNIDGASVTGASFSDAMCPTLEQRIWINEVLKTAQVRGSVNPVLKNASFSALPQKVSVASMIPSMSGVDADYSALNQVLATGYHDRDLMPSGILNAYSTQIRETAAQSSILDCIRILNDTDVANILASARVNPQGENYIARMIPNRRNVDTFATAARRATTTALRRSNYLPVYRRTISGVDLTGGLNNALTAYGMAWARNDGKVTSPEADADLTIIPFLSKHRLAGDKRHNATMWFKHYFRDTVTGQSADYTYTYDATDYDYSTPNAPWIYSNNVVDNSKAYLVGCGFIWAIYHRALWATTSAGASVLWHDDAINTRFCILSQANRGFVAQRVNTALTRLDFDVQAPYASNFANLVNAMVNVAALPSTTCSSAAGARVVGYQAYIEPCYALFTASAPFRNIGV